MKMKNKIIIGLGILFVLIFVISIFSISYINEMSDEEQNIIKDNYQTLKFVNEMSKSLNSIKNTQITSFMNKAGITKINSNEYRKAFINFDKYLKAEENNITEHGEGNLAKILRADFNILDKTRNIKELTSEYFIENIEPVMADMENTLFRIHDINMNAISQKNEYAKHSSEGIVIKMSAVIAFCLVLAILYYWFFPSYVSFAISDLSYRMKEIAEGQYKKRLNMYANDEFGDICKYFDELVDKVQKKEAYD